MLNIRPYTKRIFLMILLSSPLLAAAADKATVTPAGPHLNVLLITMVGLAIILLAIIGLAGLTLRNLSIAWQEKNAKNGPGNVVKSILLLVAVMCSGLSVNAAEATSEVAPQINWDQQVISGIPEFDFYLIMGIIALEFLVIICLLIYIRIFIRILNEKAETAKVAKRVVKVSFWDRFNKVVPIEKEKDIMLDHNYDGIQELDNSLPPWWKYGFYLTIVIGVIYLWRFHVSGTGPNSEQEYYAEVQKGEEEKAAYLAKSANNMDENTVTLATDEAALASGKKIFETSCAACHANDGGGGVGPNLADEYWLHGGDVKDVFKSIKYGWQEKGMKSWKDDLSPKQIAEVSSFIKGLKGTKPAAPKAPQGDISKEEGTPAPAADSTAAKVAVN